MSNVNTFWSRLAEELSQQTTLLEAFLVGPVADTIYSIVDEMAMKLPPAYKVVNDFFVERAGITFEEFCELLDHEQAAIIAHFKLSGMHDAN